MKKALNFLVWFFVSLTIVTLIFTLLTTYNFYYLINNYSFKFFCKYSTLEWCIFFTMLLLGIKLLTFKDNIKNVVYSGVCFLMAFGAVFFLYIGVS